VPAVAEDTVSVEVPEPPVMLVGLRVAVSPADGLAVKDTVPVKPLTGETVIMDVPEAPALMTMEVGLAVIVKSWTTKVTVAECTRVPLVDVTVTVNVPLEVNVQDSVEVPEPVTVVGDSVQAALLTVSVAVPENPLMAASVMVEVPAEFTLTATVVGLAVIVKSWTVNVTVADADCEPLVPDTVTV